MEKIIYNKLVRDKILEIAKKDGWRTKIKILQLKQFQKALFYKLREEVEELIKVKNNKAELIKEIGDVYEVIEAIIKVMKLNQSQIMKLKKIRKKQRGGFNKRVYLISERK